MVIKLYFGGIRALLVLILIFLGFPLFYFFVIWFPLHKGTINENHNIVPTKGVLAAWTCASPAVM